MSLRVIEHFRNHSEHGDLAKSTEEVALVLQSQQIDKLEVPAGIAQRTAEKGDSHLGIEFWVHPNSSTVFLVVPYDDYRQVDGVIKQRKDGFVLGDS
ncbi:hypothetical protein [Neptuniibacter sp.]|uniref:hypothetical protein n=1 Tax=Neptuniibacter sp. TaxID=1962643 RepID=UPI0026303BDC|nr:hypothetical protein [Neptuniibacter sp.]MCP4596145.1 hypothetical protein [Neptuniibacter sp.]